jgi:hypothetical protein
MPEIRNSSASEVRRDPPDVSRVWKKFYAVDVDAVSSGFSHFLDEKRGLKRWHENIATVLEQFDWKSVAAKIRKTALTKRSN